jgi:hypothetical protein
MIIDIIDVIVPPPILPDYTKGVKAESYLEDSASFSAWLRRCRELTQQQYRIKDEAIDALWRTLICNRTNLYKRPGPEYHMSFRAWSTLFAIVERWRMNKHPVTKVLDSYFFHCLASLIITFIQLMRISHVLQGRSPIIQFALAIAIHLAARHMQTDVLLLILRWLVHYIFLHPQKERVARDIDTLVPATYLYSESFGNFISGRTFCTTRAGRVGMVHTDSLPGDHVVVFCGSPSPFVVRLTEGGRFLLVGDAYVHGCMEWSLDTSDDGVDNVFIV